MKKLSEILILSLFLCVSVNATDNYKYTYLDSYGSIDRKYSNSVRLAMMTPERRAIFLERNASRANEQKVQMNAAQETMKYRRDKIRSKRNNNI